MGDGTRLAIAILILFLAMVAFFFAFHPGGVADVKNPGDILKFMFTQFDNTANGTGASANSTSASSSLWQVKHCNSKAYLGSRNCKVPKRVHALIYLSPVGVQYGIELR